MDLLKQIEPRKAGDLAAAEEVQPEVQDEVFPYVPSPTETAAPDIPGTATDRAPRPTVQPRAQPQRARNIPHWYGTVVTHYIEGQR